MTKLTDTQAILLSTASQRDDHSLYPLPDTITAGAAVTKAIKTLIAKRFAEERETHVAAAVHRTDGDLRYGLFATDAGLAAIGIGEAPAVATDVKPARSSKSATVIALLERPDGATMSELIAATDWLPHTTRAALTGLRRKGHTIERIKRDDQTCYRIVAAA